MSFKTISSLFSNSRASLPVQASLDNVWMQGDSPESLLLAEGLSVEQMRELYAGALDMLMQNPKFITIPDLSSSVAGHIFADKRLKNTRLEGGLSARILRF